MRNCETLVGLSDNTNDGELQDRMDAVTYKTFEELREAGVKVTKSFQAIHRLQN